MTPLRATERYEANAAAGDLGIVQDLANTIGVGPEGDLFASAEDARAWLESIVEGPVRTLRDADLVRLLDLRRAVRVALNGEDGADEPGDAEVTLRVRVDHTGISPRHPADPVEALGSRVAYALIRAQARGEIARLKLCANPRCRVAFFDESRNGAGRWHSSARCGNAARVRAHRDRIAHPG